MGCQIVTDLAVRRPHRVGPLVLIAPTIEPARRAARHQFIRALRASTHEPTELLTLAVRDTARRGVAGLHATARSALADRIEDRLPDVHQRTVVVHGVNDRLISRRWAEEVASLLPHGTLLVVPDGSHAVPYTHPWVVAEVVEQLIASEAHDGDSLPARGEVLCRHGLLASPCMHSQGGIGPTRPQSWTLGMRPLDRFFEQV